MRNVVIGGKGVGHSVVDAKANVGEAHAGHILAKSHLFAAFGFIVDGAAKVVRNDLNGFDVEHVGEFPSATGDVALNRVGKSIHPSESG